MQRLVLRQSEVLTKGNHARAMIDDNYYASSASASFALSRGKPWSDTAIVRQWCCL
jgi:hypothetical protein